jgi:hypothetical protein
MTAAPKKSVVRCAIYTRVSTDAGLEQDFNSLDAQYDASQALDGSWRGPNTTTVASRVATPTGPPSSGSWRMSGQARSMSCGV